MSASLREEAVSGMIWSALERIGTQVISFITNILLARLLVPDDFGKIGMIMVFVVIANTFVESGFGSALIQKKYPTKEDYSTIFFWNLIVSSVLYVILFVFSKNIASFYEMEGLDTLLKVQGVILIINAFNLIPNNYLVKRLSFRIISKVNILATSIGALIGIVLAYLGYGVWSLVCKTISTSAIQTVLLWSLSRWRPILVFSFKSFKELFSYGSLILLSSIANKVYENVQSLIIGKAFSASTLGYYTQAKNLEQVPSDTLSVIVNQVTFPILSKIQDEKERVKQAVRHNIQMTSFLNFPLSILLIVVAEPLLFLLYTEKWAASVPIFKILCLYSMLMTVNTTNIVAVKSVGKSNLFFYSQVIKRVLGISTIILGLLLWDLRGLLWAIVFNAYLWWFIGSFYTKKAIGYGFKDQIKDVYPWYMLSFIVGIVDSAILHFVHVHYLLELCIGALIYIILYLTISAFFHFKPYPIYKKILLDKIKPLYKK